MLFKSILLVSCTMFVGCADQQTTDKEKAQSRLTGWRYGVKYSRAADLDVWVPTKGSMEYWFFQAGVFRQIGVDFIEPQFFDVLQACNGTASGSFVQEGTTGTGDKLNLSYDGVSPTNKGLCGMSPRSLLITIQPSGAVDVLDDKVALRLERIEAIQ